MDARRRLFEQVREFPGTHLRELSRATGLALGQAKYHLLYMEKHRLVSSRKEAGFWRFFPTTEGSVGPRDVLGTQEKTILGFLRRPQPLHIALRLLDRGEATPTELAGLMGLRPSTLSFHLRRMEAEGLVLVEERGRERVYRLHDADRILRLLMDYRPPDVLVQGFLEAWDALELR